MREISEFTWKNPLTGLGKLSREVRIFVEESAQLAYINVVNRHDIEFLKQRCRWSQVTRGGGYLFYLTFIKPSKCILYDEYFV